MALNTQLTQALNQQINAEQSASLNYLSMAAYFDSQSLPGFAAWFKAQSAEEQTHAMRIYDFLIKRGATVELAGPTDPVSGFASPSDAIAKALEMEKGVTAQINALFALAQETKEFSALSLLNWFLDEQTEEEDTFQTVFEKVVAAQDDRWNLLILDQEMGTRGAETAAE